jgi:DNA-binding CsgD family transcriptional regulator/tetratricopeptide (TPR) repeat protein
MAGSLASMLAARAGLSPVMVGRAEELARLRELAARAAGPEVVLLAGEAGVGKTRLVAELVASLDPSVPVLAGRASQGAPGRPFELLLEAVEQQVAAWEAVPEPLAARAEPLRLLLGPVAPGIDRPAERDYGPEELLRAAGTLVRELAGPGPAVLVFEDLHWADAQSVALFGRLALAADLPALLVGTFRPEGVARRHPLVELLADLERQRSVTTIALNRLDQPGVAALLAAVYGHPVPFRVSEALHRRTGGNPFFLEELVVTAGKAHPERLASLPLPWNLAEAVLRRLDELEPRPRQVVETAAILGQRIPFDVLAAVTGYGEEQLIPALRQLVAENLVVEEEPDVFAFRHALTREAIAGRLLGRERRRLHEKALGALQEAGSDDWAAIAWHAEGAGRYDEMVEAARSGAAHYLQRGATAEALRLAEQGLAEAERDPDLLAAASKAAWLLGLLEVAIEHGERWHAEARRAGPEQEALSLLHLARVYWEARDHQRQWQTVWAALRVAERLGPSPTLARAHALVAEAYMLANQGAEAIGWADRALALADQVGSANVRASALVNKGTALIGTPGRRDEGVALLERAAAEAEAGGHGFVLHRALHNLFVHEVAVWPAERSRAVLRRMRQVSEQTGRGLESGAAALEESSVAVMEGDLAAARTALQDARRGPISSIQGREPLWAIALRDVELLLEAGQTEEAIELLERSSGPAAQDSDPCTAGWVAALWLAVAARRGDPELARRALADTVATPLLWTGKETDHGLPLLTNAVRAGMPPSEVRAALASSGLREPPASDSQRIVAGLGQVEAALLEAEGDPRAAADAYLEAAASPHRNRAPYALADCHQGAARCLLALGDRAGALAQARHAERLLRRWPGWRRDEVRALLRRLGAGAPPEGPAALTPREREVAALLAGGLSNGEVARRLYISTKTASVHVSNILSKLGMSSRTEVAAWAVRVGLDAPDTAPPAEPAATG